MKVTKTYVVPGSMIPKSLHYEDYKYAGRLLNEVDDEEWTNEAYHFIARNLNSFVRNRDLEDKLGDAESERDDLKDEIESLKEEISRLQDELAELKSEQEIAE